MKSALSKFFPFELIAAIRRNSSPAADLIEATISADLSQGFLVCAPSETCFWLSHTASRVKSSDPRGAEMPVAATGLYPDDPVVLVPSDASPDWIRQTVSQVRCGYVLAFLPTEYWLRDSLDTRLDPEIDLTEGIELLSGAVADWGDFHLFLPAFFLDAPETAALRQSLYSRFNIEIVSVFPRADEKPQHMGVMLLMQRDQAGSPMTAVSEFASDLDSEEWSNYVEHHRYEISSEWPGGARVDLEEINWSLRTSAVGRTRTVEETLAVQAYALINACETQLAAALQDSLIKIHGSVTWWIDGVPLSVREKASGRWEGQRRKGEAWDYLDLPDLAAIFKANYKKVRNALDPKREKSADQFLSELGLSQLVELRNRVMHAVRQSKTPISENEVDWLEGMHDRIQAIARLLAAPGY